MELILISPKKLKVMLTPDDMAYYDLTCESIDYDNTETRRAFWNILDDAKHQTGFDAARERVFIQVYPSRSGGCEIFVTKIQGQPQSDSSENLEPESDMQISVSDSDIGSIALHHKAASKHVSTLWRIDSLNSLIKLCDIIDRRGEPCASSAYSCGSAYFLLLSVCGDSAIQIASEFALRVAADVKTFEITSFLAEHCTPICRTDAVHMLGSLAV